MRKRSYLDLTPAELLGRRFVVWGLGFLAIPPLLASCHVGDYLCRASWHQPISPLVTMWALFPWAISIAAVQAGGIGMAAFGALEIMARSSRRSIEADTNGFWLCAAGLGGLFVTGFVGYLVLDAARPSFFYSAADTSRELWYLSQGPFVALYCAGIVVSIGRLWRGKDRVSPARLENLGRIA
jgi:hypothetical protein